MERDLENYNKIYSKLISLIISSIIATYMYLHQYMNNPVIIDYIVYFFITLLAIMVIGIPISILIDSLAVRFKRKTSVSLFLHSTLYMVIFLPLNIEEIANLNWEHVYYILYFSVIPFLFTAINILLIKKIY